MQLIKEIKPVTHMKTRAAEMPREMKCSRRPVVITQSGEAQAVVLDVVTHEVLRDAALLLQLTAQAETTVDARRTTSQSEVFLREQQRFARVK